MRANLVQSLPLMFLGTVLAVAAPVERAPAGTGNPVLRGGAPATTQSISDAEASTMQFIREEEKLARDVYVVLSGRWGLRIFDQIAESEQTHFEAVGTLLERYGVEDPARVDVPGQFVNQELQELYNTLVAAGQRSVEDALKAGVLIEEKDIEDLEAALSGTDQRDIERVYTSLMAGSFNHLEAFESHLGRQLFLFQISSI